MLCLNNEIDRALKKDSVLVGLLGDDYIYEFYEAGDRKLAFERIIYEEISNVPQTSADNLEKSSRITYRFSVCAEDNLVEIINAVERVMISINFSRLSSEPIRGLPMGISGKTINFITIREC